MQLAHRPYILLILDGWGYSEDAEGNAILQAHTPVWDALWKQYPHTLISASGEDVGLPAGQMGNSKVGHIALGSGRLVPTDYVRINEDIEQGSFKHNQALRYAVDKAVENGKAVHILGLLSPGGVHSHEDQIAAMVKMAAAQGAENIYVHAFLDGRDTAPKSALASIRKLQAVFAEIGAGKIVSLCGRYYAMDRDNRWDRTEKAYDLLTQAKAQRHASTAEAALDVAYAHQQTDEFVEPISIGEENGESTVVQDGDSIIFMNFRADRARQLTHAFVDKDFSGFERKVRPQLADFVCLTEYANDLDAAVAYHASPLENTFAEYLSGLGLKQLHITETEKYAHVTFFFNGRHEKAFPGEERILVPSPKVATYDEKPEMSAVEITDCLVDAITAQEFDVIICNFANADMVGHTGKMNAAIKAVETIDVSIGRIITALQKVGGEALITADHGNAERLLNSQTGQAHTAHTSNLVPLVYVGEEGDFKKKTGSLADVVPTLLHIMHIRKPVEMTGENLLRDEH